MVGLGETSSTRSSTSLTMSGRSALGLPAGQLLDEELAALLERGGLLEREWVDATKGRTDHAPRGATASLILADETAGLGRLTLVVGPGNERIGCCGPKSSMRTSGSMPSSSITRLELLDPGHPGALGDLVAVGGVGEFTQLILVDTHLLPEDMDGLVALGAHPGLNPVTGLGSGSEGGRDSLVGVCRGDGDHASAITRLPLATLLPLTQPLARGSSLRAAPSRDSARPLTARARSSLRA